MTYLAPVLQHLGYIGTTGTTPYFASTSLQVATLQNQIVDSTLGQTLIKLNGVIHHSLNFDGTQNNREYVTNASEVETNVAKLEALMNAGVNEGNGFYFSGIGAQTVPAGSVLSNGQIDPRSSPSNWESTPWKAGQNGNEIIDLAYVQLTQRVSEILATDPTAQISLNLTGFSRGSAQAVAFANLLNERGITGLFAPGEVPINSMVLFDPVSQTDGLLNVDWPTNLRNPALVFVATAENRTWFPAMPVGADSIIMPIEGVHSDVGGSFNPDGISAVTLKIAHDYLSAAGVPMADIPAKSAAHARLVNQAVNGVSWRQAA